MCHGLGTSKCYGLGTSKCHGLRTCKCHGLGTSKCHGLGTCKCHGLGTSKCHAIIQNAYHKQQTWQWTINPFQKQSLLNSNGPYCLMLPGGLLTFDGPWGSINRVPI